MQADRQLLLDEAVKLERLMADLTTIRTRHDAEWGKALVSLRRQMSAEVSAIAGIVRPMLNKRDYAARSTFSGLYSTLLTRLALHQANWSAVRLAAADATDDDDYQRSALTVDEANLALIRWLREAASNY